MGFQGRGHIKSNRALDAHTRARLACGSHVSRAQYDFAVETLAEVCMAPHMATALTHLLRYYSPPAHAPSAYYAFTSYTTLVNLPHVPALTH
jgi:hypothetical protein